MSHRKICPLCSPVSEMFFSRSLSVSNYNNYQVSICDNKRRLQSVPYQPITIPALGFNLHNRQIHTSVLLFGSEPLKPSSKVEEAVQVLKDKAKENTEAAKPDKTAVVAVPKKALLQKIKDEIVHYYHGFKLLAINFNVSRKLIWRVLNGNDLTRRERKLVSKIGFKCFILMIYLECFTPLFTFINF